MNYGLEAEKPYLSMAVEQLPSEKGWLQRQAFPVLAWGKSASLNADVLVGDKKEIDILAARIRQAPLAALTLVQVLRVTEDLPIEAAMTVESLAYAMLQGSVEFAAWLDRREETPTLVSGGDGPPVLIARDGAIIRAELNRPLNRNALTVEMRDALIELFNLMLQDDSIERLELSGAGACFCVGGELREFGLAANPATAHYVRSTHNPSRLLARCASRVTCYLHGACLGSGIELPAFAGTVVADRKAFFQLPELMLGLIPGAGGCVSIARRIGRQRTAWLALSGKRINAVTAKKWRLVDEISA